MGGRDQHVGVARAGLFQHVGVAGPADHALNIQRVGRAADQVGIHVDQGDIVLFTRQMPRDLPADLACPADDDLHRSPRARVPRSPV